MKAVIQRVGYAEVFIDGSLDSQIGRGILALIGLTLDDTSNQADKMVHRIINFRIFPSAQGRMDLSLLDVRGDLLLVPQFTLAAATKKGLKPSFSEAMPPPDAAPLFTYLVRKAQQKCASHHPSIQVATGKFQTTMHISSVNEGPVTFILDS